MLPLYREEALRHATGRLDGKVLLPAPLSTWLIGGVLVAALVLAASFAATASYARSETVRGWLAPESGVVRATAVQRRRRSRAVRQRRRSGCARRPSGQHSAADCRCMARYDPLDPDAAPEYIVRAPIGGRVDALVARLGTIPDRRLARRRAGAIRRRTGRGTVRAVARSRIRQCRTNAQAQVRSVPVSRGSAAKRRRSTKCR